MKKSLLLLPCCFCLLVGTPAAAWDGFDAETTELVEITPDRVPSRGETVEVRTYDGDTTETCLVESVIRNKRTVEVTVRTPQGNKRRTLVMEGK